MNFPEALRQTEIVTSFFLNKNPFRYPCSFMHHVLLRGMSIVNENRISIMLFHIPSLLLLWKIAALLISHEKVVYSYEATNSNDNIGRRVYLNRMLFGAPISASVLVPTDAFAIISSKYCANGKGEGCEDLAEGNEFIRSLQARSAANAEANEREARYAYYMKNYPDFLAAVGQKLVMKPDGRSFMTVSDEELAKLIDENKVSLEYPMTKGGKIKDLTQKPIMMLKNDEVNDGDNPL